MPSLTELLEASAALHRHLCPRQVLGVRMGMLAGRELGLALPQIDTRADGASAGKRLLTIVETDGCACDGISAATGCWVGRRTLRVEDYGKVAATFVDTHTKRALRIIPRREARSLAAAFAPEARNTCPERSRRKWEAQRLGYQRMPDDLLLTVQVVTLAASIEWIVSRAGRRAACQWPGRGPIRPSGSSPR